MTREFLLVDGYNIIFAWDKLAALANESLDFARVKLAEILSDYGGITNEEIILVFDAQKVAGGVGSVTRDGNITIVFTKEAETADSYIERTVANIPKRYAVRVATSDSLEQVIIMGHDARRISALAFQREVETTRENIRERFVRNRPVKNNMLLDNLDKETANLLEQMRRSKG